MSFLTNLSAAYAKRRAYQKTVYELKSLPLDTALDLDLYAGDAERIAARAVYGR